MKTLKTFSQFLPLVVVFCFTFLSQTAAQLKSKNSSFVGNDPALDSLERASLSKSLSVDINDIAEKTTRKRVKSNIEVRLFQHTNSLKFQIYVDNKTKQKVLIRLWDKNGILVFEDVPQKRAKFQRAYDFSYLPENGEYSLSVFYENQNHYFSPTPVETAESIEELAKLDIEYPKERVEN